MTLNHILERIGSKKTDYVAYNFIQTENNALMTFFDLAQEFDGIEDFYRLCVAVPKGFFGLEARLYVVDPRSGDLSLVSKTEDPEQGLHRSPPSGVGPQEHPYYTENSLVLTIRGKKFLIDQLPFKTSSDILGLLEIYPAGGLGAHQELFFEKYANRLGFNIHNRFLVEKNIEHLRFIRSLVADIEHNIIVPNMVYKLFLRRLKGKITKNLEIEKVLSGCSSKLLEDGCRIETILADLTDVNQSLTEELDNIEKHYRNMSLFLETLFRRSHFDQGRLTLRTKQCNMKRDVVQPQLERYMEQFRNAGISVDDRFSGIPDEEVISVVDVGLMAQVYANLFSNAVKYTEEITADAGEKKKYIAYGREVIRDFFSPGKDGVKYNVFSSGPHIPAEERERIFEEEFRGSNVGDRPGTGHGLAFIKNAVEIHGGMVGYEATQYGNNFFFILPR
ncbi:MAG TPA: ATP-binding protein [Thermodesulfovibrionales bacterium]|nr:ATP-binding protein [Thermodesulfovibrionales bacterium]